MSIKNESIQYILRIIPIILLDGIIIAVSFMLALSIRFEGVIPLHYVQIYYKSIILIIVSEIIVFHLFSLYTSLWKYASIEEMLQIFFGTLSASIVVYFIGQLLQLALPKTVYLVAWMMTLIVAGAIRISYRVIRKALHTIQGKFGNHKRIMVIGAGATGSMVIKELVKRSELNSIPVVVIDDNKLMNGKRIHGVKVRGNRYRIEELARKLRVDEIVMAIPSASPKDYNEIVEIASRTKCKLKTLPAMHELISEEVSISQVRDVNIEDLLGRDPVKLNVEEISDYLQDEVVLVTGGGGSIGSELCRQVAKFKPRKLLVFDIYENAAYELFHELKRTYNNLDIEVLIGSVRDKDSIGYVFEKYRPGVVFHAAAHKHVPLMEINPVEAVKNNVIGTLNTAECADEYSAKKFILVSTDKAVNPTNVMGATKRMAEIIIQFMGRKSKTEFAAVRFGNVLGSNGSVIPLFKKQIASGGPVTITHPDITRFFMTIPEAAQLLIQAGALATGGAIFILDMGRPVKIIDLAKDLIRLSGYEPDKEIKIEYTGLRPGEKLYEELFMEQEAITATKHEKIFIGKPIEADFDYLVKTVKNVRKVLEWDANDVRVFIERIVPTYKYNKVG